MSFGTDILLLIALGFVVLGPKRMQQMLQHAARVKAEFDRSTRSLKAELNSLSQEDKRSSSL